MNSVNHPHQLEPNFNTLALSIASSALMALGEAPDPSTGQKNKDLKMAQFNIDLLALLEEKTKNNLTKDESEFLQHILSDLKLRYVNSK
ncbi:MAG: DUF1844 domain-containing protein [Bdellovibrionales bacterium]|nr:DUF1844 domain-containing protein [Bdellovibrionales bacterium]